MKLQELSKLIQEIVRKEIRSAIKDEMKDVKFLVEVLTEASKPKGIKPIYTETVEPIKKPVVTKSANIDFGVKNPMLNELLQETAQSFNQEDYKNVMNMTSNDVASFGNTQQFLDLNNRPVDVPEEISTALTRDYSALMDKIAEKDR